MGWFSFRLVLEMNQTDAQLCGGGLALILVACAYPVVT